MSKERIKEIRNRYEQFKYVTVNSTVMETFAQYMKEKMTSRHTKKLEKKDLGLAAVNSHVIFTQMARQESKNHHLVTTDDNRASMKDLNAIRPTNYLSGFLERVTDDVKIPKHHVKNIQEEKEFMASQDMDASMYPSSVMINSNKASFNIKMGSL